MQDQRVKADDVCKTAEEFSNVFYENIDKKRHLLSRLYLKNAVLSWNGQGVLGNEEICKFLLNLPTSEYTLNALDCQRIEEQATQGQLAIVITIAGNVKYKGKSGKNFTETFVITNEEDKWKIVTDTFRFIDSV